MAVVILMRILSQIIGQSQRKIEIRNQEHPQAYQGTPVEHQ